MSFKGLLACLGALLLLNGCVETMIISDAAKGHHDTYRNPCKRLIERHLSGSGTESHSSISPHEMDWEDTVEEESDEFDYFRGQVDYPNEAGVALRTFFLCQMAKSERSLKGKRSARVAFSNERFKPYGAMVIAEREALEWKE